MTNTNTASGAAMQLADQYAAAHAKWALEDLYGTSKSYTAKMLKERHALRSHLAAALASPTPQADSQPAPVVGTIAHVGTGKTTLTGAIASALRAARAPADSVTAPAAGAVAGPSEAPEGWRNQFAEAVYADLEAADNQDVPLEEYPARILKVLDSIVGPRHPTVIHWRNDAIQACIAIAYKYCRDPESFQYLKQDLQALIFAARDPADSVTAPAGGAGLMVDRATVIEWLDANDIEVTDRQMEGLFHFAAPTPPAQAADSVLEDAALSSEQQRAIFEAYENAASESYFEVRPQIDCSDRRRVFKAGYERGWDAARKQGANHD